LRGIGSRGRWGVAALVAGYRAGSTGRVATAAGAALKRSHDPSGARVSAGGLSPVGLVARPRPPATIPAPRIPSRSCSPSQAMLAMSHLACAACSIALPDAAAGCRAS
jgi:hypothetical protein